MNSPEKKHRGFNSILSQKVIKLQAEGYHYDYYMDSNRQLLCAQNNQVLPVSAVLIHVAEHVYDQLNRSFKFIHTIDTGNGEKGVMIADSMITNFVST